jgi:asparagine synthase (glutamine-hydrolysing)
LIRGKSVIDFARINVQQFEEEALRKVMVNGGTRKNNYFYDNKFFTPFDPLTKLLLLDFKVFLPDDLLVKIDRSTMRVSLEGREPLLDHRLIEFMGRVNSKSKLNYGSKTTKYYLKQVAHKHIPEKMLNRPKMGFTPPLAEWMRGPLKDYVMHYLNEERTKSHGLLNYAAIDKIKCDFYNLNYDKAAKKIWNILMFEMWYEKWMH